MTPLGVTVLGEGQSVAEAIRESRTGVELWWPLALAGLATLIVEAGLATWFSRRALTGTADEIATRRRPRLDHPPAPRLERKEENREGAKVGREGREAELEEYGRARVSMRQRFSSDNHTFEGFASRPSRPTFAPLRFLT